jgi:hypothetical protein
MAVTRVSPGDPHAVGPVTKRSQYELGADAPGARHSDHPEIGRVLKPADPCQVRCTITAPMTKKSCNLGFPVFHSHLLLTTMRFAMRHAHCAVPPHFLYPTVRRVPYALRRSAHTSFIMAMIWPSSRPFRFRAPDPASLNRRVSGSSKSLEVNDELRQFGESFHKKKYIATRPQCQ